MEKLVSTVAAQKLILEMPAGNVCCPLPSTVTAISHVTAPRSVPSPFCCFLLAVAPAP